MTDNAILDAALDYLARGWSVLCLCPPDHIGVGKDHGKRCGNPGKVPLPDGGAWKEWQEHRADEATIRQWWTRYPNANLGVALGEVSGLVGVDIDGPDGETLLAEKSGGDLPATLEFRRGEGRRLLYRIPQGVELRPTHQRKDGGNPLSFLGRGSQTVMPPSKHETGDTYAWVSGPDEIVPALAPTWLVQAMSRDAPRHIELLDEGELIPQGARDSTLTSIAGTLRKRGLGEAVIYAALDSINRQQCDPPLEDSQVRKIATSVVRYGPDPFAGVILKGVERATANDLPSSGKLEEIRRKQEQVQCWIHDELLRATFPPQTWLVDGLVVNDGLTLLGGKKKLGKSWLCLQFAQAVATGKSTLGKVCPHPGPVYYLCLEDGARRLQSRLGPQRQAASTGLNIRWYTRFPRLDGEGMDLLIGLAEEKPRMIVVDTLAAAKSGKIDENAAGPMADIANSLRQIGQHFGLGVIVVVHHGKTIGGEDPGDDIRGSSALAAAADVNMGLYREAGGFRLKGEGRDIDTFNLAVKFGAHASWQWQLIGDALALQEQEAADSVRVALSAMGEADIKALATQTGKSDSTVRDILKRLEAEGEVVGQAEPGQHRGRPRMIYSLRQRPAFWLPDEGETFHDG